MKRLGRLLRPYPSFRVYSTQQQTTTSRWKTLANSITFTRQKYVTFSTVLTISTVGAILWYVIEDSLTARENLQQFYLNEEDEFWNLFSAEEIPVFIPSFYLKNTHLQTIGNAKYRALHRNFDELLVERRAFHFGNDAQSNYVAYLDIFTSKDSLHKHDKKPVLFFIPGVYSGTDGVGVKHFLYKATQAGYKCAVLNFTSNLPEHSKNMTIIPGVTHGSKHINSVLKYVKQDLSNGKPVICIGISLGSNIVVKYLSEIAKYRQEHGAKNKNDDLCNEYIDFAISLANPFDLQKSVQAIQLNKFRKHYYDQNLVIKRREIYLMNLKNANQNVQNLLGISEEEIENIKSVKELDEKVTMKLLPKGQFANVDEFYVEHSCAEDLKHVQVPLFIVNALDDPISLRESIPNPSIVKENHNIALLLTKYGGHFSWLQSYEELSQFESSWIEKVTIDIVVRQYYKYWKNKQKKE